MEIVYVLVEDRHRVIVISDSYSLCQYFKAQFIQIFGTNRELDIFRVDKENVSLGCALSFDLYYRNSGGNYGALF